MRAPDYVFMNRSVPAVRSFRRSIYDCNQYNEPIMRKTATLLSVLLWGGSAWAQIPNANFENWTTADNGTDSLIGWSSSNAVVIPPVQSLYRDTAAYQGDYDAHIVTAPFGFVGYSTIGMLVNGKATFSYGGGGGGANVAYESGGGTPVTGKPTQLKGFFRYETLTASDQGYAQVALTKYNVVTQKRDTVSHSTYSFSVQPNWTAFTIPLPDLMPGINPDTITMIFSSSVSPVIPATGAFSDLFLDSLTLTIPSAAPVAAFTAAPTTGTTATVINFTDNSTNTPTAWKWTITPNNVAYQPGSSDLSANPSVKFTANGSYTVKLRVSNASGQDSLTRTNYITIGGGTGVEEVEYEQQTPAYPNPATDKLFIRPFVLGADLQVTDVCGKVLLHRERITGKTVDISSLQPGVYFIRLSKGDRTWSQKLLIKE